MKNKLFNRLIVFIALSILAVGCVSTDSAKKIKAFSDATVLTTKNTVNAFDMVERSYFDVQVARIVANYDNDGFNPKSLKRFLSPVEIEARTKVLKGLQKYSEKLSLIMGNQQLDEFDKQTKDLGESLTKINNNNALEGMNIDPKQIQIFTTAVNTLGHWFIEHKREVGVKKSVKNMQIFVDSICSLLSKDIGSVDPETGIPLTGLRQVLWNSYSQNMQEVDSFIQHNKAKLDPVVMRNEIKVLASLVIDQKNADETLKGVQKALGKLKEAHNKLNEVFSENTIEIDNLIKQLKDEGKRIKKFYESLEK